LGLRGFRQGKCDPDGGNEQKQQTKQNEPFARQEPMSSGADFWRRHLDHHGLTCDDEMSSRSIEAEQFVRFLPDIQASRQKRVPAESTLDKHAHLYTFRS
jgi:hypothetical protein